MRYLGKREANYYGVEEKDRILHNDVYIDRSLKRYQDYFDNLFKEVDPMICLDKEQRTAILIDEDYEIVVAGAGSGKTTTMVGKVKFLVECLHVDPQDILVISYTNKAVDEVRYQLCDMFNIPVQIGTFHRVAFKMLKEITNVNYNIEAMGTNIISQFIYEYLPKYPKLCLQFNQIFADYFHFSSKKNRLLHGIREYVYSGGKSKFLLDAEIDAWYQFAEKYQCELKFYARLEKQKYFCSFIYHQTTFYVDYFSEQTSAFSKIRNHYNIYKKMKFHKQHHSHYFVLFKGDDIEQIFLKYAREHQIIVEKPTIESIFLSYTSQISLCKEFIDLIYSFLMLWKKNGKKKISRYGKTPEEKIFLDFLDQVSLYYQNVLKQRNCLDFEDMIQFCTLKMNRQNCKFPRYIIVDEYQDISEDRFRFLRQLCKLGYCKLIVVGDDWQSIYRFSGSKLDLFTSFQKYFKYSQSVRITKTYRNSQQLINISGKFVMKNGEQLKKQLTSFKQLNHPIYFSVYKNTKQKIKCLMKVLDHIYACDKKNNVLVLSRFHFDFNFLKSNKNFEIDHERLIYKRHPDLNITCLTTHASKGLGFDQVIILNNEDGEYGFPSLKSVDPYLNLVQNTTEEESLMEERRLFYVALTRTKNYVYLLISKEHPSIFVQELKKEKTIVPL